MYKQFVEAVSENKGYEFITQNYYRMSADELSNICKELMYTIESLSDGVEYSKQDLIVKLIEEIEYNYFS